MNASKIKEILISISKKINEEKDFLTDLDNAIADGDHGMNMARGFLAVEEMLNQAEENDLGIIFKNTAMKLISTVGGAAGPLYGTAFLKASAVVSNKTDMNMDDFLLCLQSAIEGVKFRGKSIQGEKTMLDAMIPAYEAINSSYQETKDIALSFSKGIEAAWQGVEYTKTIIATKGRASYIGERSIGHQDPGATSFTFILETIAKGI